MSRTYPPLEPIESAFRIQYLNAQQLDRLQAATLEILEHTGVRFPSDKALAVLAEHGAQVDRGRQLVKFPRDLVFKALATAPRYFPLGGREPIYDFHLRDGCTYFTTDGCGVETIDLYLLHRADYLCQPAEVAAAFSQLKQQGKVREFGVSNFRPSQVSMLQRACPMPLIVNQVQISLAHLERLEDGTLDQCLADRITPMAWSPLHAGQLADVMPIDLRAEDHVVRIALRETQERIARERGTSRMVIALAWLLKHPAGIIPIVGSTRSDRIKEAAQAADLELTREEWYQLLEAARGARLP